MSEYCLPVSKEHSVLIRQAIAESCDTLMFMYQSNLPFTVCLHCRNCEKRCLKIDVLNVSFGIYSNFTLGIQEIFHAFVDGPTIVFDILLFLRQNPHVAASFQHLYKLVIHQSLCIPLCLQRTHLYSLFPPFTSLSKPSILNLYCHTLNGQTKTDLCTLCCIVGPIQYVVCVTECINGFTVLI